MDLMCSAASTVAEVESISAPTPTRRWQKRKRADDYGVKAREADVVRRNSRSLVSASAMVTVLAA